MSELGDRLKAARIEKGLSLDDLQNITKIQKRYLIAIEEGNFSVIPGNFYVRAFIKQYSDAVGLNPEVIFDEYRKEIPSVYDEVAQESLSRTKSKKVVSNKSSKIFDVLPKVITALFIVGIVITLWYFIQTYLNNNNSAEPVDKTDDEVGFEQGGSPANNDKGKVEGNKEDENSDDNPGDQDSEDPNNGLEEPEKPKQEIAVIETSGSNSTYELKNAEKFELSLKATEGGRSWIRVVNGNEEELFRGEINDSNPQTFDLTDQESVWIRIGLTKEFEIYVNGEKLEYAIDPTKVNVQNVTINFIKEVQ